MCVECLGIMLHCRGHGDLPYLASVMFPNLFRPTPITLQGYSSTAEVPIYQADDMEASQCLKHGLQHHTAQVPRPTHLSHSILYTPAPAWALRALVCLIRSGVDEDLAWREWCAPHTLQHCCLVLLASNPGHIHTVHHRPV